MIDRNKIQKIIDSYDINKITIGVLGGHSALDVCRGAKKYGFKTIAVCQKGREKTYTNYFKSRKDGRGCVDNTIVLNIPHESSSCNISFGIRSIFSRETPGCLRNSEIRPSGPAQQRP